ncbi:DUF1254 domain-containing protein [Martelella endophytica]|uniref:DUF1254 domain-containing protein n=1 Tax=Martelella endophytica TaxID=1486262 RepID=A0A0D5LWK7_MAREN|nr:DUF1254 domain-containing protein [Martelella endophytica]AJY48340.1 hypothetical protein TM49_18455 [Martelella endophytica]
MNKKLVVVAVMSLTTTLLPVLSGPAFAQTSIEAKATLTAEQANAIADTIYMMAYPMMLMDISAEIGTNVAEPAGVAAPINQFANLQAFPDASFDTVVRPNADTLYSSLTYDVSKEPLIISIPASQGRYYLFQMMDEWTDVYASPGSRTTGDDAYTFAVVGPDWQGTLPEGVRGYVSPTAEGWVLGRVETKGKADYDAVHAFQDGLKAVPLSAWGTDYVPPKGVVDATLDMSSPVSQIAKLDGPAYFQRFAELMKANPPHANDDSAVDLMKQIGLVPGESYDPQAQSKVVQDALAQAPTNVLPFIQKTWFRSGDLVNGWRINLTGIGSYGSDYMHRAGVAFGGLGANKPVDAVYPSAFVDADGHPFDSSKDYVLHFEKDALPPARAFWSVTLYNQDQFFAKNPIHRYSLGSNSPLKENADGSVDLYIQRESPGKDKEANWLPAPESGHFSLTMRIYWPELPVLSGEWSPPPVERVVK